MPSAFLDVLRVQNGGPIRFRIPNSVGDTISGIGPRFPSITDSSFWESQEYVDFSLDGLVPFDGDGHWFNCLDFRKSELSPSVAYVDIECNSEHQLADGFAALLNQMELDVENERVLAGVRDIVEARERLEKLFGTKCEKKINNIGVRYLKFQIGDKTDECLWISSNEVAAGYSGDKPSKFNFEGNALLFPELTSSAVIFECPNRHLASYKNQLREVGLDLQELDDALPAT